MRVDGWSGKGCGDFGSWMIEWGGHYAVASEIQEATRHAPLKPRLDAQLLTGQDPKNPYIGDNYQGLKILP